MATHSLSTFLGTLQSAVGQVQEAAATRHRAVVERMVELGQDGLLRSQSWTVHVPAPSVGERRTDTVVFPLLSLRPLVMPQVAGFRLEVAVTLEKERQCYPGGLELTSLVIPKYLRGSGHELRRLRVELRGPQPGAGEVRVDDVVLRRLDGPPAPDTPLVPLAPRPPLFQRVLGFLFRLCPFWREPIRLRLSEEDTRRLKDSQSMNSD